MREFNRNLAQKAFQRYNKGLREEIENHCFDSTQDIVNYVRSKLNFLYINKEERIYRKEGIILDLKNKNNQLQQKLDKAIEALEYYAEHKNSDFDNQDYFDDTQLVDYYEFYDKEGNAFLTVDVKDKRKASNEGEFYQDYMYGKRARAALKEINE